MKQTLSNLLYYLIIAPMAILGKLFGFEGVSTGKDELHDAEKTYEEEDFEKPW